MREAIRRRLSLDDLHYSNVLVGLRELGFALDAKKGLFNHPVTPEALSQLRR
jgi:hypothetical protein